VLERLFGETAATYAIDSLLESRRHEMEAGQMHIGPRGRVLNPASVAAASAIASAMPRSTAARIGTREGGGKLRE
jgi:hypothetical protein